MNRPNIVLITIDALRADTLGCYGAQSNNTPNIDRLAQSGFQFEQAITGGSWTQAAFPVIFTSTYASWYGGCLGPLSTERPSPIEALSKQGYSTIGFSTNPHLSQQTGYGRGFRQFYDLVPAEKDPWLRWVRGGMRLLYSPLTHSISRILGVQTRPASLYVPAKTLTDRVLDELNRTETPFLLWAHYMDVHWPYHVIETLREPTEIAQAWKDVTYMHRVNWKGVSLTPERRDYFRQLYETALRYTDEQIGRLWTAIRSTGLHENTVLILAADHGEEFMDRKHWGHVEVNLYDEIVKVPLIISLPGKDKGKRVASQVRTLDIMPTILDLCACPQPAGLQGRSITPLLNGKVNEETFTDVPAICEMWRPERHIIAVRTVRFKYIWDSKSPDQPVLFDLVLDPKEKTNIISDYPGVANEFQEIVSEHLKMKEHTRQDREPERLELDHLVRQRLRDLGYLE